MVLALSAIVVSGVMFYYQSASDSNKTQNTISEVMSTIAAVNGLYVGQATYTGLTNDVLWNSSAIPQTYKGDKGLITNPFGGSVAITAGDLNANKYSLTLNGIPRSACVNIASMNLGTSLAGVGVGMTGDNFADLPVTTVSSDTKAEKNKLYSALSPQNASLVCQDENNNAITYVMK
ncbi:TPA: pilus assembly protein [Escherichia coli]|nr:pilus assembly protein [Escherichia coli]HBA6952273.1 pilus assembly protein [Escherichia coli]HBA7008907.1 pilus assembly protein [Escherichia coli]HBA7960065.1 pilus assembly protein [Escherichia coli]HBA8247596.1 pilus assembly protein [Escherichia coli]